MYKPLWYMSDLVDLSVKVERYVRETAKGHCEVEGLKLRKYVERLICKDLGLPIPEVTK